MKVSVCIPSYNLAHTIARTIESVLAQDFDGEVLIEDDGSTDNSLEVIEPYLKDPRITLTARKENLGANVTTNNLVRMAQGEYLCLLPADDTILAGKIAKQVAYLDVNPECGIVFGHPQFCDQRGVAITTDDDTAPKNLPRNLWQTQFRTGNCFFIATSMYRRSLHEKLGYFSEELEILADLEWYARVVKEHDLYVFQEPMAVIMQRDNAANLSAGTPTTMEKCSDEMDIIRDRHYKPTKQKFMIATPFYDVKGFSPYIVSLVQTVYALARHSKQEFEYVELSGDSYVWRARNLLVERFMHSDCTDLIFIDSDHAWSLESIIRLMQHDAEIVGGAYPTKNNWEHYSVTIHTTGDNHVPDVDPATGLIRAEKVPTGFMKIKRSVFEKLKKAYKADWYWEGHEGKMRKMYNYFGHKILQHVAYGEDISFCKRWEFIGGKLWVEPRCTISHIGTKTWTGNYHEFLMRQPGGSEHGNSPNHH